MKANRGLLFSMATLLLLAAPEAGRLQAQSKTGGKIVARDGAQVQRSDRNRSTRVVPKGTKIRMIAGKTVIPATLNDGFSSRELIARLPYSITLRKYAHDYCGVMPDPLRYREADVHYGWLNGDIDFARDGDYLTILYKDEESSEVYGHQVNLGVVDCDLSLLDSLGQTITLRIELAE